MALRSTADTRWQTSMSKVGFNVLSNEVDGQHCALCQVKIWQQVNRVTYLNQITDLSVLFPGGQRAMDQNTTHDVHVTQLAKPEVVNNVCRQSALVPSRCN